MIKQHTQRANYLHFLRNVPSDYAEDIGADIILQSSLPKWKPCELSSDVLASTQPILHAMGLATSVNFDSTTSWRHGGKNFSIYSEHVGNSYIEFEYDGHKRSGVIQHIIRPQQTSTPIFVLHIFPDLDPVDENRSPYRLLPHLHATVKYNVDLSLLSIGTNQIFGHCAALHNSPGKFGISKATVSLGIADMSMSYEKTI
ncbi:uncharacterized protein MELLADRAFT_102964 [Melampsora larici-populina 98AG31]|uniref:Uncharacterized protein n=1 Tax=Melampsora larici-populina (strain 98AG31 / pathotype 3-4-7) TaxID=747676 RepID=F4RA36_MELLP|nr:uncharacterized protein MELLADRAFT_102964 [Melampsora larici-populina 98AG31]EGG10413.1 hypothetical protein MELLADRAFT_102964 [Melampsora larici-populina 98AG31]